MTIDCPSDCAYLREARQRERPAPIATDQLPNQDVRVTEQFIDEHRPLLTWVGLALAQAMTRAKAVDRDAREALEALIQTYRTLQSGLIYETRPTNPYAAAIQAALKQSIEDVSKRLEEKLGMRTLRDKDVLGVLVYLQWLEIRCDNGRRRGRAFYDFLYAVMDQPVHDTAHNPAHSQLQI